MSNPPPTVPSVDVALATIDSRCLESTVRTCTSSMPRYVVGSSSLYPCRQNTTTS